VSAAPAQALRARAPAKVNLALLVGPVRVGDGRHELVSVMDTVSLADELTLRAAAGERDEVRCPGVQGPNLVSDALRAFREATRWDGPPVLVEVVKRIPVAGGMAGGSADAAAALRLLAAWSGLGDPALLERVGSGLGADVPSQVRGGRVLACGAGEVLAPAAPGSPYGVLVVPVDAALAARDVYRAADRAARLRTRAGLEEARRRLAAEDPLRGGLAVNDLQDPARSLCPGIDGALDEARSAGADVALVSGSGPTVLGLFAGEGGAARAEAAAGAVRARVPGALAAVPVGAGWGAPRRAPAAVGPLRHNPTGAP
jgi:4-diphosphocytidyl-2-C-methyl-D-erythritol kinase